MDTLNHEFEHRASSASYKENKKNKKTGKHREGFSDGGSKPSYLFHSQKNFWPEHKKEYASRFFVMVCSWLADKKIRFDSKEHLEKYEDKISP